MNKLIISLLCFVQIYAYQATASFFLKIAPKTENIYGQFNEDLEKIFNAARTKKRNDGYSLNGIQLNNSCQIFINKNLNVGALGAYTINELTNHPREYPELMGQNSLSQHCANFPNLEPREKSTVWTLVLMAMAQFESSCSNNATNTSAPNGIARGLFQLHQGQEKVYDGKDDACVQNASYSEQASVKCALGMLNRQMIRSGGVLFYSKSYWDVLRPAGEAQTTDDIARALARTSLCQIGYMQSYNELGDMIFQIEKLISESGSLFSPSVLERIRLIIANAKIVFNNKLATNDELEATIETLQMSLKEISEQLNTTVEVTPEADNKVQTIDTGAE